MISETFETITLLIFWFISPFFWMALLRFAGIKITDITIPSITLIFLIVYQWLGWPLLYLDLDPLRSQLTSSDKLLQKLLVFTWLSITLFSVGIVFSRRIFGKIKPSSSSFRLDIQQLGSQTYQRLAIGLVFFCSIMMLVLYIYKVGFENIALFLLFSSFSDLTTVAQARSLMGNDFSGGAHWYKLFTNSFLILVSLFLYAGYLLSNEKKSKFFLVVVLCITSLSLLLSTEKGPFFNFLIALFFVHQFIRNHGRLSLKKTIIFLLVFCFLLIPIYSLLMTSRGIDEAILGILSRISTGQMHPAYVYLDYISNGFNFIEGRSFPNPGGLFNFQPFDLTVKIMEWYSNGRGIDGVVGSMPTIFWGELYVNFGVYGILLSFFVGVIFYVINRVIVMMAMNNISISLYVWFIVKFKSISGTGVLNFIFDITIYGIFLLAFFILAVTFKGKIPVIVNRDGG